MANSQTTKSDLREQVESLKERLAEETARADRAEAMQSLYRNVARDRSSALFTVDVDPDGRVTSVAPDPSADTPLDVSCEDIERMMGRGDGPKYCRRVVDTGRPCSFPVRETGTAPGPGGESCGDGSGEAKPALGETKWIVHLAPSPDDDQLLHGSLSLAPQDVQGRTDSAPGESNGDPSHHPPTRSSASTSESASTSSDAHGDLYQAVVEHFPDAVFVTDDAGAIRYANRAAARLVRAEASSLQDDDLNAYLRRTSAREHEPPSGGLTESRALETSERRAGADEDEEPELFVPATLFREDGTTVPVEVASSPITYRGHDATLTTVRTPSGQKRMEETVTRTLNLFDKAFHLGPAALLIVRLRDGVVLEVSDQAVELSEYDADDLVGRSVAEVDVGLDDDVRRSFARTLLSNRRLSDRELVLQTAEGDDRAVLCSARLTDIDGEACALVSLVDITQRKEAAVAERESRTLLHKIFRASPAPIAISRLEDGRYIDVNEAMCSLVGYPHDEIVGRSPETIGLLEDEDRHRELRERLHEEDAVYDFEARFRTASGDRVTTLSSYQRIQVEGRECVLAVMTDITQREEARQALVEAKEKAEEARAKAEDVAQFRSSVLSNMTHEVRTPLTVILGFTSMLRSGVDPEYKRFVNLIERSGRRLLLTLDSLLDLAQIEAGALEVDDEVVSVPDVLHSISGPLAEQAESKGLTMDLDISSDDRRLCARIDHELFERVVNHLVDNAVKFTSDGAVTLRVRGDQDAVHVDVEDTGPGIDEDFLPRIFDAFAQESEGTTRSHQGSGLGLTVSKRIVERMDGTISIASTRGEGTTVTVTLPRVQSEGRRINGER